MSAFGYCRISTDELNQPNSLKVQEQQVRDAWARHPVAGKMPWGGFFFDSASAHKVPFCDRLAGRKLNETLKEGDFLFLAKVDRTFRSMKDQVNTVDMWKLRGVKLVFLDLGIDTSTEIGELMLNIAGSVAQFESRRTGQRIREAFASMKKSGKLLNQHKPIGWKRVGKKGDAYLVPDYEERKTCEEIHRLHVVEGMPLWDVGCKFRKERRPYPRKTARKSFMPMEWAYRSMKRMLKAYREGFPCPQVANRQPIRHEENALPQPKDAASSTC